MSRQAIGETLSRRLHRAEAAIDAALRETATLASSLPAARVEGRLSAVTGQGAFDGTAAAISALTQARSHLVHTHATLSALARRLGLAPLAVGPLDKPDDTPPIGGNIVDMRGPRPGPILNKSLPTSRETC